MTDIRESFKQALKKVEDQIETKGAANSEDVAKLQMWQAMLGVKTEAERSKGAIKVEQADNS